MLITVLHLNFPLYDVESYSMNTLLTLKYLFALPLAWECHSSTVTYAVYDIQFVAQPCLAWLHYRVVPVS